MTQGTQEAVGTAEPDAREFERLLTLGRRVSDVGRGGIAPVAGPVHAAKPGHQSIPETSTAVTLCFPHTTRPFGEGAERGG